MKHAFLIMAHGSLPLLRVLLSMLDDERNDIFLHIDRKSDMLDGAEPLVLSKARLFVLEQRVDVRWGNLSQIKAEYVLFEEALKHGPYAYYHLLSGQDLPIKSQDYIHQFLVESLLEVCSHTYILELAEVQIYLQFLLVLSLLYRHISLPKIHTFQNFFRHKFLRILCLELIQ